MNNKTVLFIGTIILAIGILGYIYISSDNNEVINKNENQNDGVDDNYIKNNTKTDEPINEILPAPVPKNTYITPRKNITPRKKKASPKKTPPKKVVKVIKETIEIKKTVFQPSTIFYSIAKTESKNNITDKFLDTPPNPITSSLPTKLERTITIDRMIHTQLYNSVDSEIQGDVILVVTNHVYSTHKNNILIPAGSRIKGSYNSDVQVGQKRLELIVNTIITPRGIFLEIENNNVSDLEGRSGIRGEIDTNVSQNLLIPLLFTIATATSTGISSGLATTIFDTAQRNSLLSPDAKQSIQDSYLTNQQQSNAQLVNQLIEQYIKVNPIIKVDKGAQLVIFPKKNIVIKELPKI